MNDATTIRLALRRDAGQIANMSREFVEAGLGWSWRPSRIRWHIEAPESCVIVANDGADGVAAFACASFGTQEAHLNLLCVDPMWRREGVGTTLVQWLETSALTAGLGVMRLEVRSGSTARRFYAAIGYREVRRRHGYYYGRESAIEMIRDLWQASAPRRPRVGRS